MGLLSPIHAAVYTALAGVSPPIASGRIYDAGNLPVTPPTPEFPYVVLSTITTVRADDKGGGGDDGHGVDFTQTLEIWARDSRGKKDAEEIMDAIYDALHDVPLALSTGTMVTLACENQTVALEADGLTINGTMEFTGYAHT